MGVAFESVSTDVGSCVEAAGTVDCTFGTLQPGDLVTVTVQVLAVDVGTPVNTATAATPSVESTTADNADDASVTILPTADLAVTKTAPATVVAGDELDYVLEVTNNGASPATGVTLSDTLPAGTQFVSADPGCSHLAGVVTCAVGPLAVLDSRSFTVTVAVPFALGDQIVSNTVIVDGNEGDLVSANDSAQASTTVGPAADLMIAKTAGGATAGKAASWTIVVQNLGPSAATPVEVSDTLPAGTALVSATPSQGTCGASVAGVSCDLGTVAAGGAAQVSIVATVPAGTTGLQLRNLATVSAPQPDPDPSNNDAEALSTIAAAGPDLTLTKTASTERPQLGKRFSYTMAIHNAGDFAATGVRLVDTLSQAVRLKSMTPSQGSCSGHGGHVTCALGTLAPGERATVVLVVVPMRPGHLRNAASAMSTGGADLFAADNTDIADVRVTAPRARWSLKKRASRDVIRGGDTVRFTITVRTRARAVADATVCDRLPSGLVFVRARGAQFRNGRACWSVGYLAARSSRTFRVTARGERGFSVRRVRNVAVATAPNARRRTARARVQIDPAFGGASGGVTG